MSTDKKTEGQLIEDAADKLDQIMDRLDQIACPDLYADLQAARSEIDELRMSLSKQTEYAEILAEKAHNMEVQRDEARARSAKHWRVLRAYRNQLRELIREVAVEDYLGLQGQELWGATAKDADGQAAAWSSERRWERQEPRRS